MSINLYCPKCKTTTHVGNRRCAKCNSSFGSGPKKYKVRVRGADRTMLTKVANSLPEAKELEARLKVQLCDEALVEDPLESNDEPQVPLVDELWDAYIAYAEKNKKSWKDDAIRWRIHVEPQLSGKRADEVRPYDVQAVLDRMKEKGRSPATIKQVHILIKRVYNWSDQMELYEGKNPGNKVKSPKVNNEKNVFLTTDQVSDLLKVLDEWPTRGIALMVKFALFTGVRKGETYKLEWQHVDMDRKSIKLVDPKGGDDQTLPISDAAVGVLREALKHRPSESCPYVFPTEAGTMRKATDDSWKWIRKKAGLPNNVRYHDLRHTYASLLASSGKVTQYTLQKLLTHKTPQMTQRYSHLTDQTLRDAANVLEEVLN